jgi:predicted CXXCH cytochrome family protein
MRRLIILSIILIILIFFLFSVNLTFSHPPHKNNWTADINKLVNCTNCHRMHGATGPSLTRDINAALCMSCHTSTSSSAPEKPFANPEQSTIASSSGTSHRWDSYLPTSDSPDNRYGLRPVGSLENTSLENAALKFKDEGTGAGGVTCSTCHMVHDQNQIPWDPYSGTPSNDPNVYRGTATGGSTTTIEDTSKAWTTGQWTNSLVVISGPTSSPNFNKERRVASNNPNTLTISPAFSTIVSSGETYSITSGRHYTRVTDTVNALCIDCHYYRSTTTETDVRTYSGTKKSHPIGKSLTTVSDPTQFVGAAPFEPQSANWAAQTGSPRYAENGGSDNNTTNNSVLDSNSMVRCLSCHGIHYTDSDSSTEDRSSDDRMP